MTNRRVQTSDGGFTLEGLTKLRQGHYSVGGGGEVADGPDTARTVEDLKERFSDGGSNQDLRDFVQSFGPGDTWIARFQNVGFSPVTIHEGPDTPIVLEPGFAPTVFDPSNELDPQGWLGSGTYASPDWYSQTFPDAGWVLLPPGVYWVELFGVWQNAAGDDLDTTGTRRLFFADVDNRFATDGFDTWYSYSSSPVYYDEFSANLVSGKQRWNGAFRVKNETDGLHFAVIAKQGNTGSNVTINSVSLNIMRTGPSGG